MVLLFFLMACGADGDGDGVVDDKDCAPDNGAISSLATEACNGVDDDCDDAVDEDLPLSTWYRDGDGDGFGAEAREACAPIDGFVSVGGDCDDAARWVYPGATEVCGGVDEDCDSAVDEDPVDLTTWYLDADGDGWGDDATLASGCTAPAGSVGSGGDCDDTDAGVSPDGAEVCGGADEDCDGLVDGADPDIAADPRAAGGIEGYRDADGDGWGGEAGGYCPGEADGWTDRPGDCDDDDASAWPGAPEDCAGGADHDCDGRPDDWDLDGDGSPSCEDCDDSLSDVNPGAPERCNGLDDDCDGRIDADAEDAVEWHHDDDFDGYGAATIAMVSCDSSLGYVQDATDCDDAVARVNPGQPENCRTVEDDNCDGLLDEPDAQGCTEWYVDADADGWGDSARSVCQCEAPGAPYVVDRGEDCVEGDATIHPEADDPCGDAVDADCDLDDACAASDLAVVAVGPLGDAYSGYTLTTDVDVTGDGVVDLVSGSGGFTTSTSLALVYAGPLGTTELAFTAGLSGVEEDGNAGRLTVAADVTGDGVGDVLVGDDNGEYGGRNGGGLVHVFAGPITTSADSTTATLTVYGETSDSLGRTVDIGHDVDGDGGGDVVVGGLIGSYGGYCGWPGTTTGAVTLADAAWCVSGDRGTGLLGHAIDVGDVTGDGVDDLVYGMYTADSVAWMEGPVSGFVSAAGYDGAYELDDPDEYSFGTGHTLLDDVDGDGRADLAASSESKTWYFGALTLGTSRVLASAGAVFPETRRYDETTPALGLDLDGDGTRELVLGAPDVGDGMLFVYPAPISGTLSAMDATLAWEGDGVGRAVAAVGDVDSDGLADLYAGADTRTSPGRPQAGAVLLLPGAVIP